MSRLLGRRVIGSATLLCTQLFRDGGKESIGRVLMRLGHKTNANKQHTRDHNAPYTGRQAQQ